mmetsp:Transcript_13825/g.33376  ORF Transcript_13825/g.33376 Transcript_13825/m.33376 type:complete len:483 (-) Transcript_13825:504-1952(-)
MYEWELAHSGIPSLALLSRAVFRSHRVPHSAPELPSCAAPQFELGVPVGLAREGVPLRASELGRVAVDLDGVVDSRESNVWRLAAKNWHARRNLGERAVAQAARGEHTAASGGPIHSEPLLALVGNHLPESQHVLQEDSVVHVLGTAALHRLALLLAVELACVRALDRPALRTIRLPVRGIPSCASVLDCIRERNLRAQRGDRSGCVADRAHSATDLRRTSLSAGLGFLGLVARAAHARVPVDTILAGARTLLFPALLSPMILDTFVDFDALLVSRACGSRLEAVVAIAGIVERLVDAITIGPAHVALAEINLLASLVLLKLPVVTACALEPLFAARLPVQRIAVLADVPSPLSKHVASQRVGKLGVGQLGGCTALHRQALAQIHESSLRAAGGSERGLVIVKKRLAKFLRVGIGCNAEISGPSGCVRILAAPRSAQLMRRAQRAARRSTIVASHGGASGVGQAIGLRCGKRTTAGIVPAFR